MKIELCHILQNAMKRDFLVRILFFVKVFGCFLAIGRQKALARQLRR
jgi:hypothetical protein